MTKQTEKKTKEQNIIESSKSLGRPNWPPRMRSVLNGSAAELQRIVFFLAMYM